MRFTGWVDYARLPDIIAHCDLGLLPFHSCPHIDASLANKLFEYMSLGLPVVASDVPPHRTVIDDARNGVVFPPGDADALALRIAQLADAPEERASQAAAGLAAATDRYNWDCDAERLLGVVDAMTGARAETRPLGTCQPDELGSLGSGPAR